MSPVAWIFATLLLVTGAAATLFWLQVRRVRQEVRVEQAKNLRRWIEDEAKAIAETEMARTEDEAWERFQSHTE